jgi:signal transduction histidine kinase
MQKPRLLIVEDDVHLLEGVQSVLELEGYDIITAENGLAALHILCEGERQPDLIISDIMMPQMDGLQFLREVRKDNRFVNIPFIFLTARGEKRDIHTGKRLGVDDYIIKPFDTDDLLIAIESRLHRHRALGAATDNAVSNVKRNILNVLNHEFRTPLTYIVAYADMLNQPEVNDLAGDEMLTFLRGVNSGALRLRRLVENFIQLVELESGEAQRTYNLRKVAIDRVQSIYESALAFLRQANPERVINPIAYKIAPDLPRFIGDPDFLRVAFMHLIDNAIKFSHPGHTIDLCADHEDGHVLLSVRDYGRGINPDEVEKIWDMFYQINRAYYEDQGVGAGLPIVRGIARLHGGRVTLKSALGEGSTFTLRLPLTGAKPPSANGNGAHPN